jgi:NNP family nitrate/nitrite transporter-like MFS transporter
VPVIQLVGLAIIATAGTNAPRILPGVDIPLIVIAAVCAARLADPPGRRAPCRPAGRRG